MKPNMKLFSSPESQDPLIQYYQLQVKTLDLAY